MDILGLVEVSDWLLVLFGILLAYYIYMTWNFNSFAARGIAGPKPWPVVGTLLGAFTKGFMDTEKENTKKYGKVYGTFEGRSPVLVISDEEMLKEILVKQFHNFTNRRVFGTQDDVSKHFITVIKDDDWKRIRNTLTPSFTSGKLKGMTRSIHGCAKIMADNVQEVVEKGESVEMKEIGGCFTMDVIARVGFGVEIDSQKDKNSTFVKMGKKAFSFSLFSPIILVIFFAPFLMKVFELMKKSFFPKDITEFFGKFVKQSMENREESGKKQADLLQLMVNAGKKDASMDVEAKKKKVPTATLR